MKQDHIEPHQKDTPIPDVSDKDVERLVFRNLEARQKAWEEDLEGGVVILQYPDTRTFFQRLAAWWRLQFKRPRRDLSESIDTPKTASEPVWPGHWATSKYL